MSMSSSPGPGGLPTFEEFVAARSLHLLRLAVLLTGNGADADDLLQGVLEKALRRWRRIGRTGNHEAYVRKMLVNASLDRWRQLRHLGWDPVAVDRQDPGPVQDLAQVEDRQLLMRTVRALPSRQRAVVALRYWEDLSESQIAELLGCSPGTVKSHASRALASLRAELGRTYEDVVGGSES